MEHLAHDLEPYNLKLLVIKQKTLAILNQSTKMFLSSQFLRSLLFD